MDQILYGVLATATLVAAFWLGTGPFVRAYRAGRERLVRPAILFPCVLSLLLVVLASAIMMSPVVEATVVNPDLPTVSWTAAGEEYTEDLIPIPDYMQGDHVQIYAPPTLLAHLTLNVPTAALTRGVFIAAAVVALLFGSVVAATLWRRYRGPRARAQNDRPDRSDENAVGPTRDQTWATWWQSRLEPAEVPSIPSSATPTDRPSSSAQDSAQTYRYPTRWSTPTARAMLRSLPSTLGFAIASAVGLPLLALIVDDYSTRPTWPTLIVLALPGTAYAIVLLASLAITTRRVYRAQASPESSLAYFVRIEVDGEDDDREIPMLLGDRPDRAPDRLLMMMGPATPLGSAGQIRLRGGTRPGATPVAVLDRITFWPAGSILFFDTAELEAFITSPAVKRVGGL